MHFLTLRSERNSNGDKRGWDEALIALTITSLHNVELFGGKPDPINTQI